MAKDIWIISDTHFGHTNFLKFRDSNDNLIRPFFTVDDMDEYMVTKWNEIIKPHDKVYHLGDVFFGNADKAEKILARLHGKKRLLLGNHDILEKTFEHMPEFSSGWTVKDSVLRFHFEKIMLWRPFGKEKIMLSHIPLRKDQMGHDAGEFNSDDPDAQAKFFKNFVLNVHGHIHHQVIDEPEYYNACVEHHDYSPIHLDTLIAERNKRAGGG